MSPAEPAKTHTCFFYGTLMAPSILARVTGHSPHKTTTSTTKPAPPRPLHIRPAMLLHHRRHRVLEADYPAVVPSSLPGACVRGTCVSGLTDADVWRLDVFEGCDYARKRVSVRILREDGKASGEKEEGKEAGGEHGGAGPGSGEEDGGASEETETVEAETYIWIAAKSDLEDSEWDFDEFVREKMWRWDGGAERQDYTDVENAVAAMEREGEGGQGKEKVNGDPTGGRGVNGGFEQAVADAVKSAV